jgi:tetratricopeptide (TPR) repeat protein
MSKYNTDLDYVIPEIDISWDELSEIKAEADKIISESKESIKNLAMAYLKRAQIKRKGAGGQTCGYIFYEDPACRFFIAKDKKEFKKLIEKAMELIPDMPEALMQLGLFNAPEWSIGDYNKAIKFYNRAIQLKPDYAAAFNNRAMLFYQSGFFDDENDKAKEKTKINIRNAVADLTEAIKIRPFDAVYYLNRGVFHSRLGEHKEAIEDFSNAIKYASDALRDRLYTEVLILNLRGKEYTELKDYDKAIDDFSETLHLKQEYDDAYLTRKKEIMELKDDDKLVDEFYESLRSFSNHDETLLLRGKSYYLAGEKDKAKADIEEYLNRQRIVTDENNRNEIIRITGIKPEDIL